MFVALDRFGSPASIKLQLHPALVRSVPVAEVVERVAHLRADTADTEGSTVAHARSRRLSIDTSSDPGLDDDVAFARSSPSFGPPSPAHLGEQRSHRPPAATSARASHGSARSRSFTYSTDDDGDSDRVIVREHQDSARIAHMHASPSHSARALRIHAAHRASNAGALVRAAVDASLVGYPSPPSRGTSAHKGHEETASSTTSAAAGSRQEPRTTSGAAGVPATATRPAGPTAALAALRIDLEHIAYAAKYTLTHGGRAPLSVEAALFVLRVAMDQESRERMASLAVAKRTAVARIREEATLELLGKRRARSRVVGYDITGRRHRFRSHADGEWATVVGWYPCPSTLQ